MKNRFDPQIFVAAQDSCVDRVREELASGRKQSHWMWFMFPQIAGLGSSPIAKMFALAGLAEARTYLAHPLLGRRLRELTGIVMAAPHGDAEQIFGHVDALKFCSCMTLFRIVAHDEKLFDAALEKFFAGRVDPRTVEILRKAEDLPAGWPP
jgi:uncharacterized protein (DUF1810 family)